MTPLEARLAELSTPDGDGLLSCPRHWLAALRLAVEQRDEAIVEAGETFRHTTSCDYDAAILAALDGKGE